MSCVDKLVFQDLRLSRDLLALIHCDRLPQTRGITLRPMLPILPAQFPRRQEHHESREIIYISQTVNNHPSLVLG